MTGHKEIAPTANIYSPKCYILYAPRPTCWGLVPLCMPPFNYKRGGMRRYNIDPSSDSQYITQWSMCYALVARTTLNPRVLSCVHPPTS
jgi:hypothetical protein